MRRASCFLFFIVQAAQAAVRSRNILFVPFYDAFEQRFTIYRKLQ